MPRRPEAEASTWQIAAVAGGVLILVLTAMAGALLRRRSGESAPMTMAAPASESDPSIQSDEPKPEPDSQEPEPPSTTPRPIAPPSSPAGSGQGIVRERVIRGNAEIGSGDSTGGGSEVDASAVARIIRGQLGGIQACYERELASNPGLSGRLEMSFTIGEGGRITRISAAGPVASAAPAVGSCVSGRLRVLVFPSPEDGSVDFNFPFTFSPR